MISIELAEWSKTEAPLTAHQAAELQRTGAVTVQPTASGDWLITSSSIIGVVAMSELELRIKPKVDIGHLLFLLGYARDDGWATAPINVGDVDNLVEAVTKSFTLHTRAALKPSPLQGYRRTEDSAVAVRGRVLFSDQLRKRQGQLIPLEISYDEFTIDIPENRMIRAAAELLLRFPRISQSNRHVLHHIRGQLADVSPNPPARRPPITRLNQRYQPALTLADLIIQAHAFSQETGTRIATTFLFDMNRVFEGFLSTALAHAFARYGGAVRLQARDYLDLQQVVTVIPDISWWVSGQCRTVIDAKYKDPTDAGPPTSDVYQMLAYCVTHNLPFGTLVYASGSGLERRYTIRHIDVDIVVASINLSQTPTRLLAEVGALADALALAT